jgi:hypothetical protein
MSYQAPTRHCGAKQAKLASTAPSAVTRRLGARPTHNVFATPATRGPMAAPACRASWGPGNRNEEAADAALAMRGSTRL